MKITKKLALCLSTLLLVSGLALAAPALARSSDSTNIGPGNLNNNQDDPKDPPIATTAVAVSDSSEQEAAEVENHAHDLAEQFKLQAQTTISDKKSQAESHTHQQRQKACEARKANLTKRMNNALRHAQKHKATFDKIYNRVQDFYTNKNLSADNYDALAAAADQSQRDAQASIDALKALNVSVDCTSDTVAQNIAAFQAAVKSARDSLKTYRTSITDLIKTIKPVAGGPASDDTQKESQ